VAATPPGGAAATWHARTAAAGEQLEAGYPLRPQPGLTAAATWDVSQLRRVTRIIGHVAKWKPLGAHKKQKRTAGKSRLISCLALLAGILVLFFLLFYLVLQKSGG